MGEVWKARDTRLDRTVAIKRLKGEHSSRFEHEARAIAALNHPHICQIYDVGRDYLVLEYVEGTPLRGPLEVEEAQRLASQIVAALEQAHARGILHRDLKPANIALEEEIARKISGSLRVRITGEENAGPAKRFTENTEAYQLYLRGRHHWTRRAPEHVRRGAEFLGGGTVGWRRIVGALGERAEELVRQLLERGQREVVEPLSLALAYAGLGDRENALTWLEKGVETGGMAPVLAASEPRLRVLEPEPRYQEVLRKLRLAP